MSLYFDPGSMSMVDDGSEPPQQYADMPNNPLGLAGDVAAYYKAVQPGLSAYYAPGDGSFTPGGNVDIQEGTAKSVLGAHGVNTSGMSLEQLKQAATSFMNNKDWWTSPQAAQMAQQGVERGNSGNLWADTLQGALQVGGAALGINSLLGSGLSGFFSGAGIGDLAAADMSAGLIPASDLGAMGVGSADLANMGFSNVMSAEPSIVDAFNSQGMNEGASFIDQAKSLYQTAKPGLEAVRSAKKVYDIYGALTQDTAQPAVRVGGLQQVTQQGGRDRMSKSFGNSNFDAYR